MDQGEIGLSDAEFARIRARVYAEAGISLSQAKRVLVVSRLAKRVRALGLGSFGAYLDYLEGQGDPEASQDFVNALTTNLTRFYREDHHFEHLTRHVEALMTGRRRVGPNGQPRLRIWSAGCSTGQEPYTIAMALLAALPDLKRWDFRILATDIDTNVLARAASGIYPESEAAGLAPQRARQLELLGDGRVQVPTPAREIVAFKALNLIESWPMKGPFDAIFCRNVAIYFDKQTQGVMFSRFATLLAPDGFLYIGHSENLGNGTSGFKLVGKTIYQWTPTQKGRHAA